MFSLSLVYRTMESRVDREDLADKEAEPAVDSLILSSKGRGALAVDDGILDTVDVLQRFSASSIISDLCLFDINI
jgi:hypothetical protein